MTDRYNEGPLSEGRDATETGYYTLEVTTSLTRLGPVAVQRCIQIGVIRPVRYEQEAAVFSLADVARLRKVRRLIRELGLNWAGVEIVMRLTDELEQLQAELEQFRRK